MHDTDTTRFEEAPSKSNSEAEQERLNQLFGTFISDLALVWWFVALRRGGDDLLTPNKPQNLYEGDAVLISCFGG